MSSRISGNLHVAGTLTSQLMVLSPSSVTNSAVQPGANIAASKLQQQYSLTHSQGGAAAAQTRVIYVAKGSGILIEVKAGAVTAAIGDSTVEVDITNNGDSILVEELVLDSSDSDYQVKAASIDDDALSSADVLEVSIATTAGSGTLPEGVFVNIIVREVP